jgi:hypothetical protein
MRPAGNSLFWAKAVIDQMPGESFAREIRIEISLTSLRPAA